VGAVVILGLVATEFRLGGFWGPFAGLNINAAGYVIAGMFVIVWLGALAIWRFGHIEERWGSAAQRGPRELTVGRAYREPDQATASS